MRIMNLFGGKALAVALACAMVPASAAIPTSTPLIGKTIGVSEANAQYYRGGRGYHRGYNRGYRRGFRHANRGWRGHRHYRHYDRGYYHRRGNGGAVLGGAIAGLAAGAIIAGAASQPRYVERRYVPAYSYAPEPWSRDWYRYCASKYRSFDARSGTYQPYNGPRRLCQ